MSEATVASEDMIILGGFSILGDSVLYRLQSLLLVEIEKIMKMRKGSLSH